MVDSQATAAALRYGSSKWRQRRLILLRRHSQPSPSFLSKPQAIQWSWKAHASLQCPSSHPPSLESDMLSLVCLHVLQRPLLLLLLLLFNIAHLFTAHHITTRHPIPASATQQYHSSHAYYTHRGRRRCLHGYASVAPSQDNRVSLPLTTHRPCHSLGHSTIRRRSLSRDLLQPRAQ